ncbi:Det1 complexing ubiquitin ligase [Zea mays]|uniref:Det1 complexing ubiquitin ligase n=1 Tax=Zea mays TaxID=4577 RepID=A0A1D6JM68_MAIZE|nr:Det1 complexing ubiquitin ligase [Zea mays]
MGSPLGGWPSYNPHNFSQLVPADPSAQPSVECHTSHLCCDPQDRSATQSSDNHGGQEHPAEALVPEIRGEAEAKESCGGQPRSGEQQQEAAQGTCGRRRGPVERKKLKTHSWWPSSPASHLSVSCSLHLSLTAELVAGGGCPPLPCASSSPLTSRMYVWYDQES